MAKRLYFIPKRSFQGLIVEKIVDFTEVRGDKESSVVKTMENMHHVIRANETGGKILEVSPYGSNIGQMLTPWQLTLKTKSGVSYPVAAIYESSKVFERGGPYEDLKDKNQDELQKDERLTQSGDLMGYHFEEEAFTTTPRHKFFDYLYIRALKDREDLQEELLKADIVTDVTYQMNAMHLSPARSVSYFISLYRENLLDKVLSSSEEFDKMYLMTFT